MEAKQFYFLWMNSLDFEWTGKQRDRFGYATWRSSHNGVIIYVIHDTRNACYWQIVTCDGELARIIGKRTKKDLPSLQFSWLNPPSDTLLVNLNLRIDQTGRR